MAPNDRPDCIDHGMVNNELEANMETEYTLLSDHHAVVCTVCLKQLFENSL